MSNILVVAGVILVIVGVLALRPRRSRVGAHGVRPANAALGWLLIAMGIVVEVSALLFEALT